jgi:hypothetical protein
VRRIAFALALIGVAGVAEAQEPTLRHVSKVRVDINLAGSELPVGITEDRLRTLVELKLRSAQMKVLSKDEDAADPDTNPFIQLSLLILKTESAVGQPLGFVFSPMLSVVEIRAITQRNIIAPVLLWQNNSLHTSSLEPARDSVEKAVGDLVDKFLNNWLKAKG